MLNSISMIFLASRETRDAREALEAFLGACPWGDAPSEARSLLERRPACIAEDLLHVLEEADERALAAWEAADRCGPAPQSFRPGPGSKAFADLASCRTLAQYGGGRTSAWLGVRADPEVEGIELFVVAVTTNDGTVGQDHPRAVALDAIVVAPEVLS